MPIPPQHPYAIAILCHSSCETPLSATTNRGNYCLSCKYAPDASAISIRYVCPTCGNVVMRDTKLCLCTKCNKILTIPA